MPFNLATNKVIMACLITNIYDINRNNTLQDNDFMLVKEWASSLEALQLTGILFHNNFTQETCNTFKSKFLHFIKIEYNTQFNPNVYRYFAYKDFLLKYGTNIKSLFLTDVSDVVVINNPFIDKFFINNPTTIFCGDEPKKLNDDWMHNHSNHLRSKIANYAAYENSFKESTLLNCGIIGGSINMMQDFINKLCHIHQQYNYNNTTAYTGDMGAFNYLCRTQFNNQLLHGEPVNTIFKAYENYRADCWFRHK